MKHGSPHIDKAGNEVGCSSQSIRNEDAVYIMYLVCKQLGYNRKKTAKHLASTINSIISMDMAGANTAVLAEKIQTAKQKRTDLIELYTSGDIDRDEFSALRAKYDAEMESLKAMAESGERQEDIIEKQQERMEDIKKVIDELIDGIKYEDEFYAQILDKMVVNDRNNIDVYLNLFPMKWSYTAAKGTVDQKEALKTAKKTEALEMFEEPES